MKYFFHHSKRQTHFRQFGARYKKIHRLSLPKTRENDSTASQHNNSDRSRLLWCKSLFHFQLMPDLTETADSVEKKSSFIVFKGLFIEITTFLFATLLFTYMSLEHVTVIIFKTEEKCITVFRTISIN